MDIVIGRQLTMCCLVPQAIRDGVIEASINHEKGYVQSKEMTDIYSTREPQLAFHQRISFCLDIHNMSVKVMEQVCRSYLTAGIPGPACICTG